MQDQDRRAHLWMSQQALVLLFADHDRLVSTLRAMHAGYPSGHDGPSAPPADDDEDGEPEEWDRTSAAAIAPDPARAALYRLDDIVREVRSQLDEADGIRQRWTKEAAVPKRPTPAPSGREPGCEVCWTVGRYEPTYVEASKVSGNLDRPHRLCRWCYDFVVQHGELATKAELEAHGQGKKVRRHGKAKGKRRRR